MTGRAMALAAVVGLIPSITHAQTDAQVQDRAKVASLTSGSPGEAGLARPGADAILQATSDDSKATARIGVQLRGSWTLDTTMTAPLDQSLSRTAVLKASTHPLANDARFTVGGSRTFFRFAVDQQKRDAVCGQIRQRDAGDCETVNPKLTKDELESLRSAYSPLTSYVVSARLAVGRSGFSYRPSPEMTTVKESYTTPVALTVGVGALFSSNWFASVQAGGEHVWQQANDPQTLCTPVAPSSTTLSCEEVSVGLPADANGISLVFEARRFFSKFAVAPRFEYRQTKALKLFELPVYFLTDPDEGGWTGGVVFRVKNNDPSLAVFVGAALPYFGLK